MAGGARQGDDESPITDINVTPLVDVVLVLLIILMVTATAIVRQNEEIPVELPEVEAGDTKPKEPPTTLTVSIDNEGQLFLDAEPIDLEGLKSKARESREKDAETRAIINADARIPHGQVVKVIDVLRQVNVIKFAINVRPSDLVDANE